MVTTKHQKMNRVPEAKYAVKNFKASSPEELAKKIQSYFDSVALLSTVSISFRDVGYFANPTVNPLNPKQVSMVFEAVLTVRIRQEDAKLSV